MQSHSNLKLKKIIPCRQNAKTFITHLYTHLILFVGASYRKIKINNEIKSLNYRFKLLLTYTYIPPLPPDYRIPKLHYAFS